MAFLFSRYDTQGTGTVNGQKMMDKLGVSAPPSRESKLQSVNGVHQEEEPMELDGRSIEAHWTISRVLHLIFKVIASNLKTSVMIYNVLVVTGRLFKR